MSGGVCSTKNIFFQNWSRSALVEHDYGQVRQLSDDCAHRFLLSPDTLSFVANNTNVTVHLIVPMCNF